MKVCMVVADRIRINTDGFPKRAPKAQASGGVRVHVPRGKFFRFWLSEVLFPGFLSHSDRILASSIPLRWSLVNWRIIWPFPRILGHRWRKTKEQKPWNINWADFSLNRKQRSISFFVICVQNKVLTDYFISQFQLMESLFFIKTYHIYHEKSDQKYDGVDPSLHSNHLDNEVERRFGWGWQDWRTLLGKPSAFWTFNFTIFGNLAHRWMWAKPHLGT